MKRRNFDKKNLRATNLKSSDSSSSSEKGTLPVKKKLVHFSSSEESDTSDVLVHMWPVVAEQIVDHSLRVLPTPIDIAITQDQLLPVTGILLGWLRYDRSYAVRDSFPVKLIDRELDENLWKMLHGNFDAEKLKVVGWYSNAENPTQHDLKIHAWLTEQMKEIIPELELSSSENFKHFPSSPILIIVSLSAKKAYQQRVVENAKEFSLDFFEKIPIKEVVVDGKPEEEQYRCELLSMSNISCSQEWMTSRSFTSLEASLFDSNLGRLRMNTTGWGIRFIEDIKTGDPVEDIDTIDWHLVTTIVPELLSDNTQEVLRFEAIDKVEQDSLDPDFLVNESETLHAEEIKAFWNKHCDQAVKRWPRHAGVLFEHGRIAENDGKLFEAEALYERLILVDPNHRKAFDRLAAIRPVADLKQSILLRKLHEERLMYDRIPRSTPSLKKWLLDRYAILIATSLQIEGNTTTPHKVRLILEGYTQVDLTLKEINEVRDMESAMVAERAASTFTEDLTLESILSMHERLMRTSAPEKFPGQLRPSVVYIGPICTAPGKVVLGLMNRFVKFFNDYLNHWPMMTAHDAVEMAAFCHLWMVIIHPFEDGNGRTCRMLMNRFLMRAGFPSVVIPGNNKKYDYYHALNHSHYGSDRAFLVYIVNLLHNQIRKMNIVAFKCIELTHPSIDYERKELYQRQCAMPIPKCWADSYSLVGWELAAAIHALIGRLRWAKGKNKQVRLGMAQTQRAVQKVCSGGRRGIVVLAGDVSFNRQLANLSDKFRVPWCLLSSAAHIGNSLPLHITKISPFHLCSSLFIIEPPPPIHSSLIPSCENAAEELLKAYQNVEKMIGDYAKESRMKQTSSTPCSEETLEVEKTSSGIS